MHLVLLGLQRSQNWCLIFTDLLFATFYSSFYSLKKFATLVTVIAVALKWIFKRRVMKCFKDQLRLAWRKQKRNGFALAHLSLKAKWHYGPPAKHKPLDICRRALIEQPCVRDRCRQLNYQFGRWNKTAPLSPRGRPGVAQYEHQKYPQLTVYLHFYSAHTEATVCDKHHSKTHTCLFTSW